MFTKNKTFWSRTFDQETQPTKIAKLAAIDYIMNLYFREYFLTA